MTRALSLLAVLALASLVVPTLAQAPEPETGEPEVALPAVLDAGAPRGAELTRRSVRAHDRYRLPVGLEADGTPRMRALEGRVIRTAWRLDDSAATTAAVMAGYRRRLEALGYETVFACADEACGGIDFRFAAGLLPPPDMLMDAADFTQLSARLSVAGSGPGGNSSYLSVLVSRVLGAVYAQTVAVLPAAPTTERGEPVARAPAAEDGAVTRDTPRDASQDSPQDAPPGLITRLEAFGHVRLEGVDFESGSAALTPGSGPALDRVAEALAARPDLGVAVVGHSDNEGPLADNMVLSRQRAEAVREGLVARGVAAERLAAEGVGFLAPVASNATPEGRGLNRRVELVLR